MHVSTNERREKHTFSHHGETHLSPEEALTIQARQLDIVGEEER